MNSAVMSTFKTCNISKRNKFIRQEQIMKRFQTHRVYCKGPSSFNYFKHGI